MTGYLARLVLASLGVIFALTPNKGEMMAQRERETVEQPAYVVIDTIGPVEVRRYGPRLAAETDMGDGPGIEAEQETAFMRLAAYIFAQDRAGAEVAMTAPVAIAQAEPIAMTAPVAMESGERGQVMRFFMPAAHTLETLPQPGDSQVRIVAVPAQTLAVLRFSGEATDDLVAARQAALLERMEGSGWRPIAAPGFFGYDPPMTPPGQRRNEVFVEVAAHAAKPVAAHPDGQEGAVTPSGHGRGS